MTLYHGSSVEVKEPRLLKIQRELDFGNGFYTTSDIEQAKRWASRTAKRLKQEKAYVSVYEISDDVMKSLNILKFAKSDVEWLRFVVKNRKGQIIENNYDIIIGSVADDQTAPVIDLFLDGMYDEEEAIKRLLPQKLKDQYVFKTEKAIKSLCFKEVITL